MKTSLRSVVLAVGLIALSSCSLFRGKPPELLPCDPEDVCIEVEEGLRICGNPAELAERAAAELEGLELD